MKRRQRHFRQSQHGRGVIVIEPAHRSEFAKLDRAGFFSGALGIETNDKTAYLARAKERVAMKIASLSFEERML